MPVPIDRREHREGRERDPSHWGTTRNGGTGGGLPDWLIRGYTGHEHLREFSLINMNGRFYDPIVGRMLSPDNIVQASDFTQSYNRYSYVFNNPLKYTDPTGWSGTAESGGSDGGWTQGPDGQWSYHVAAGGNNYTGFWGNSFSNSFSGSFGLNSYSFNYSSGLYFAGSFVTYAQSTSTSYTNNNYSGSYNIMGGITPLSSSSVPSAGSVLSTLNYGGGTSASTGWGESFGNGNTLSTSGGLSHSGGGGGNSFLTGSYDPQPIINFMNVIADGHFGQVLSTALHSMSDLGPGAFAMPAQMSAAQGIVLGEIGTYGSLTEKFGVGYESIIAKQGKYLPLELGQKLNAMESGSWSKVFEGGLLNGSKIEVHYYFNSVTGTYYNPYIAWKGWGSF